MFSSIGRRRCHGESPLAHAWCYNVAMRKASVRDLRIRTSELIRDAENGEIIVIERRGEPVAELRPLTKRPKKIRMPDMSRFWKEFPQLPGDSTEYISEDRGR